jgi:predicted Rossmann fold flavoprotein
MPKNIVIIGGGAAGFFAAINHAQLHPEHSVILLEKSVQLLSKVRISGGGRCNVTHACFEPKELVRNYPRGSQELLGPFHRFQPRDTIAWFAERGIELKTEADGRMFPVTNSSQTIIDCFLKEAEKHGVNIRTKCGVQSLKNGVVELQSGERLEADAVILATGSAPFGHQLVQTLGHTIVKPVPSLFTFNVPDSPFHDLSGVSLQDVQVSIENTSLHQRGPFLFTHWGFSGPAVLKLSAWGARYLHDCDYQANVNIDWLPAQTFEQTRQQLVECKNQNARKQMGKEIPIKIPKALWNKLLTLNSFQPDQLYQSASNKDLNRLAQMIHQTIQKISGKTTYKEEFVTAGGIALKEVNFKTMQSLIEPKLYFAGEILDIDGVTGGFNFQNAWTTAHIAAQSAS